MEETDDEDDDDEDVEDDVKRLKVSDDAKDEAAAAGAATTTFDDGVFTVTVAAQGSGGAGAECGAGDDDVIEKSANNQDPEIYWPAPRMNTTMAVRNGMLYLYGGMCEEGDKQLTLSDFYSLDLHKLEKWNVIIKNDAEKQVLRKLSVIQKIPFLLTIAKTYF